MVDIWGFGARANDLISWFFFPGVPAAEQVRRQKIRSAFLELMRSVKESDILLFAASVDTIGNNLEVALPSRDPTNPFAPRSFPPHAFDVVGGTSSPLPVSTSGGTDQEIPAHGTADRYALDAENG